MITILLMFFGGAGLFIYDRLNPHIGLFRKISEIFYVAWYIVRFLYMGFAKPKTVSKENLMNAVIYARYSSNSQTENPIDDSSMSAENLTITMAMRL